MKQWANRRSDTKEKEAIWVKLKPEKPIVDIPKPQKEEKPQNPTAEGLYNQNAPEETVAMPTPAPQAPPTPPPPKPQAKPEPKKENTINPEKKEDTSQKFKELYGEKSPDIKPPVTSGNLNEFVDSIKVGNKTYLSVEANPQIGYFVQLKRKFQLGFNPTSVLRPLMAQINTSSLRVTLGVSIDARGNLADVKVITPSPFPSYDQECIQTVKRASPFTSPPPNLLDTGGTLNTYFSFTVHMR
ncbi:energy transducer TonB [bacterium]|nr:energy transducer TonB [bacterium]